MLSLPVLFLPVAMLALSMSSSIASLGLTASMLTAPQLLDETQNSGHTYLQIGAGLLLASNSACLLALSFEVLFVSYCQRPWTAYITTASALTALAASLAGSLIWIKVKPSDYSFENANLLTARPRARASVALAMTSSILVVVTGAIRAITPSSSQSSRAGRSRRRRSKAQVGHESTPLPSPSSVDEKQSFPSVGPAVPPTVPAVASWPSMLPTDGVITPPRTASSRRSAPGQQQRSPSISFADDRESDRRIRRPSHSHSHQSQYSYFNPALGVDAAASGGSMTSMTYIPNPNPKKKEAKPIYSNSYHGWR